MDAQRRAVVTGWDDRRFSEGFADLRRLADQEFSGAVTNGTGWLFFLNGRVISTVDGTIDDFADANGTAYAAPETELPLLFAMLEQGGNKRAQYYTNDTPLSEADTKLSAGGFTGYVELSENVLSGDYYLTYTGGESHATAFIGNSRRLETGSKAFDLADNEVGIYTVYEVDLDVQPIPEAESDAASATAVPSIGDEDDSSHDGPNADSNTSPDVDFNASPGVDSNASPGVDSDGSSDDDSTDLSAEDSPSSPNEAATTVDPVTTTAELSEGADEGGETDATGRSTSSTEPDSATASDPAAETDANAETQQPEPATDTKRQSTNDTADVPDAEDTSGPRTASVSVVDTPTQSDTTAKSDTSTKSDTSLPESTATARRKDQHGDPTANTARSDDNVFSEEAEWREAKSIPALDPQEATESEPRNRTESAASTRDDQSSAGRSNSRPPKDTTAGSSESTAVSKRSSVQQNEQTRQLQRLESELESTRVERDSLASTRDELVTERDALEAQVSELESKIKTLKTEASDLRAELERAETKLEAVQPSTAGDAVSLSASEARRQTNLFVRYRSKGGVTLEDAHDADADPEALRENLLIEHHTSFDDDAAVVDGEPFESFLEGTMEFGFTRWIVEQLPFEIRDTNNESALRDLYDALPKVDRAEIGGSVSIITQEGGSENREQREFDLVLRDRMGNPLFIAELNDTRAPTGGSTLESLVANGGDIAESNESFAGAFAVTASFFDPEALEAASGAVGGGLFTRSSRKSFVKLSRKRGYHLCLTESRDGGFHVTVPEL